MERLTENALRELIIMLIFFYLQKQNIRMGIYGDLGLLFETLVFILFRAFLAD